MKPEWWIPPMQRNYPRHCDLGQALRPEKAVHNALDGTGDHHDQAELVKSKVIRSGSFCQRKYGRTVPPRMKS